jgi:hypothetical protein
MKNMDHGIGKEPHRASFMGRCHASIAAAVSRGRADLRLLLDKRCHEQPLEALRAAGSPTSFGELEASAALPEGVCNAADVYERACAAFVPPGDRAKVPLLGRAELPARGVSLPEAIAEALAECLVSNRECLSLLREAGAIGGCHYRRGLKELLPNAAGLRRCAQLLRLNTLLLGHHGDLDGAVLSVRDGLRLADSLRRGPVLLSYLVRMGFHSEALKGLEWVVVATSLTDRHLTELDGILAASARTLNLTEALVGERSYMIETYDDWPEFRRPFFYSPFLWLACVRRVGLRDGLEYMADAIEASKLGDIHLLTRFREMDRRVARRSFVHAAIKMVAPLVTRVVVIELRLRTRLELTRALLAIERYRLHTGEVPDQLESLVPGYLQQVPVDPFDGQPVCYRRMQAGYLLYSVDADGPGHGVWERNTQDRDVPYDLCFLVPR